MIVKPVPIAFDLLATDLVRSPGLHASQIYDSLFKHLNPNKYDYGDSLPNPLLLALGTAWEKHLEYLLLKSGLFHVERPDEFISPEGIAFSPDLLFYNGEARLGEIKYTSMSATDMPTEETNCLPAKLDKYIFQMQLYAYWLEVRHGWLAILFNHRPWAPELRIFDLTFSESELRDTHACAMNHARHMGVL